MRVHVWAMGMVSLLIPGLTTFGQVASSKQLSPHTGWFATEDKLFWTTDGGASWKDIRPPQEGLISGVFFLDTRRGWVVISRAEESDNQVPVRYWLASTKDAGKHWWSRPIVPPDWKHIPEGVELDVSAGSDAYIYFWDAAHGIVNLSGAESLVTSDGGQNWSGTAGEAQAFVFATRNDGWELDAGARSINSGRLFVTHDGSQTWQPVVLPGPSPERANQVYSLPIFTDKRHGFLTVTYSAPEIQAIGLFSSTDSGRKWKRDAVLPNDPHTVFTAIRAKWKEARVLDGRLSLRTPSLMSAPPGGAAVDERFDMIRSLRFIDGSHGWAILEANGMTQLLSTSDAGSTWTNISPVKIGPAGKVIHTNPSFPDNDLPDTISAGSVASHQPFYLSR